MARNPRHARRSRGGGRFYVWGESERYWSVTTIIDGAIPKNALKWWAAKRVAEFAYDDASVWLAMPRGRAVDYLKQEPFRYTRDRADVGTTVHEAAEAYALKRPMPTFDTREERAYVASFLDFVRALQPSYVATEAEVYHRTQRYAGTLDAIVDITIEALAALNVRIPDDWRRRAITTADAPFVRLLIDYKTGGDVVEEKGVYPEAALQLNAYGNAEFMGLPDGSEAALPALSGAAVLQLGPRGWRLVPVRLDDPALPLAERPIFKAFLYAREVFRWVDETSKDVLGDAIEHIFETDPTEED